MEMNKDEALRCLSIAQSRQQEGNLEGALRFAKKSIALYPTAEAEKLAAALESGTGDASSTTPTATTSSTKNEPTTESTSRRRPNVTRTSTGNYTDENVRAVKRVLNCTKTDYYAILDVDRKAEDVHIKKAYRKMALQLHPDKNNAPGADEAFKLVSRAFTILGDSEKRENFDKFGVDSEQRGMAGGTTFHTTSFGRDGEITPEQLFNMFFGGDFGDAAGFSTGFMGPGVQFRRFGGGGPRMQAQRQRRQASPDNRGRGGEGNGFGYLIQLLPLLLLLIFSFSTTLFSGPSEPSFSFEKTYNHHSSQRTKVHGVQYYVNDRDMNNYVAGNQRQLSQFEQGVEVEYVRRLQSRCRLERERRQNAIRKAKGWFGIGRDEDALRQAQQISMPNCNKLGEFGGS